MTRRTWDEERMAALLGGPMMWAPLVLLVAIVVGVTVSYLDVNVSVGPGAQELAIADPAQPGGLTAGAEQATADAGADAGADDEATGGALGASVFASTCANCHGAAGEGGVGPPLAGQSIGREAIRAIVGSGRGAMPPFESQLSPDEVAAVVAYVVGLGTGAVGGEAGEATPAEATDAGDGGSVSGASVFASSCAGCHGASGQGGVGPVLAGRSIGRGAISSIVGSGRGAMPSFASQLSPDEVSAVVDHVLGLGAGTVTDPGSTPATQPPTSGSGGAFGLFCASCHGADGRGTELGRDLRGREDKVFDAVRFGEDEMPAFPATAVSDAQLGEIIAYVRSIKERD